MEIFPSTKQSPSQYTYQGMCVCVCECAHVCACLGVYMCVCLCVYVCGGGGGGGASVVVYFGWVCVYKCLCANKLRVPVFGKGVAKGWVMDWRPPSPPLFVN